MQSMDQQASYTIQPVLAVPLPAEPAFVLFVHKLMVRFNPRTANTTEVAFEHRLIERHGGGSAAYHGALSTPQGWPYILGRYQALAEAAGTA